MNDQLTDEQIENWRRVLAGLLGAYALVMPREQIQQFRDRVQSRASKGFEDDANDIVHGWLDANIDDVTV